MQRNRGAERACFDGRRRRADAGWKILEANIDGAIITVHAIRGNRQRQGAAPGNHWIRGSETHLEARPRRMHGEPIAEVVATHAAGVGDTHRVLAVGGWIEEDARIASITGAAVVIAIVEREDG